MKTRKGFTLVELLIVIVVIGILSAMMMLSSNEAVTSARASNVVSNLRNLKTAALGYYADHMDELATTTTAPTINDIKGYLSNNEITDINKYTLIFAGTTTLYSEKAWYIQYDAGGNTGDSTSIRNKLAGRAKSVGLLSYGSNENKDEIYSNSGSNGGYVRYRVR